MGQAADMILHNGRVFCGLKEGFVEALAIKDGRVMAVGSHDYIEPLKDKNTKMIDLQGRVATPGLNDAHMHLSALGMSLGGVNLRPETGVRTMQDILSAIEQEVKSKKPGEWVVGRGYDHNELVEGRHPTLMELDQVAPNNPVFIKRTCAHLAVVNSFACQLANINHDTPSPSGGMIEKKDGRLTGLLAERALRIITEIMPVASQEDLELGIVRAGNFMLSQGFTSVMDAGVGLLSGMAEVHAYESVARQKKLPVRTWACLYGNADGIAGQAYKEGFQFGREVGLLRYGSVKIFGDGSAGGMTAAMSEPYEEGDLDNHGIFVCSDKEMHEYLDHYHHLGYQIAAHGIGDAGIEQILTGMEKIDAKTNGGVKGRRHRIEHCGFLTDGQIRRMADYGLDPIPQPIFMYEFGDLYIRNLGQRRAEGGIPMRKWFDAGVYPAASSDAPVSSTNPMTNLYAMITRKTQKGTLLGPQERLSMPEAIHAYTYMGAYTQFFEEQVGRLVPGQYADIAIFSKDIFTVTPEDVLRNTQCDMTILSGDVVYTRQ